MGYHSKKQDLLLASASVIPLISLPLLSAGFVDSANAAEEKWDANVTARIHGDRNNVEKSADLFLPLGQDDDSLFYLDLRIVPEDLGVIQGNFGGGIRQIINDNLILGGYAFYDTAEVQGYRFHAATVGVELITKSFDAHVNYHIPFTEKVTTASGAGPNTSTLSLVGNQLIESYNSGNNYISGMGGFSGELGYTLFFDTPVGETIAPRELRLSAGAFSFDGFEAQARRGFTANAEYTLNDALGINGAKLSFGLGVVHDNINDTNLVAGVRLTIPLGDLGPRDVEGEATSSYQPALTRLEQRMVSRVRRITRMQTQDVNQFETISRVAVDAVDASLYNSIWFADGANSLGAGTQPDPTTFDHAVSSAGTNGIIVAEGNNGDITTPGGVTLQAGQEVVGGGTAIPVRKLNNTVVNFTLGQTNGVIRNLSNAANTINLANDNILQNFTVRGGLQGVAANNLVDPVTNATINNVTIDQSATDGLSLQNFSGTFTGTNITVTDAGDDAIEIFNSNAIFNFTDTTVTTAADEGVDIDNISGTANFTRTTITGAADDGLDITGSAGTFTFDTTMIENTGFNGIDINGAVGPITFNGTTTVNNSGDDGLDFDNVTGGAVTFSGPLNIGGAGDDGIDISNSSSAFSFADVTIDGTIGRVGVVFDGYTGAANFGGTTSITGTASDGIEIGGGNAAYTFGQIDITNPGADGIFISNAQGTADFNGPTTITNPTGDGIAINDSPLVQTFIGTTTITTPGDDGLFVNTQSGALTFDTLDITGGAASDDGILIQGNLLGAGLNINTLNIDGFGNGPFSGGAVFTGAAGTVNILGGTIQNVGNDGVSIAVDSSNINATFGGNIVHTGNGALSSAVFVDDTGGPDTSTLTFSAGSTISDTAGRGLQFENADGTYNFNGTTTLNGGDAGIDILGGSAGTFTFSSNTSITSPTGTAFNVDGSPGGDITYNGTITQNNAASAVVINNKTAGTTTFAGQVTASTANFGAVNLTNNTGGTIDFTGGLNITTGSGDGFGATGGGTVSATGTNSINSTLARAINLDGVTIGAGGMTFATIASTGSTNEGVRINNVGGGIFTSGATTITNAGSQGINIAGSPATFVFNGNTTITNPTDDAISLNGANGAVTFANVNLTNLGSRGIEILGATNNVTVNGGTINNAGANFGVAIQNQANTSTIAFNNVDISNDPGGSDTFNVQNSAGTINVVGGTFTANAANDVVDITGGTATINIGATLIDNGTGNGIEIDGVTGGTITFSGNYTRNGAGSAVQIGVNAAVTGGTINFNGTTTVTGGSSIVIASSAATVNFNANASVTNPTTDAIDVRDSSGNVTFSSVDIDGGVQGIDLDNNTGTFTLNGGTIDGTTGDAINAINAPVSINNVTFGATTLIGGDGIDILNSDATSRTSTISGNTIGSATAEITGRGVVIGSTGAGVATVNFTGTNTIRSTNAAIEATATNINSLVLGLDGITAERGTAGFTVDVQGSAHTATTAAIVVTSLNSLTVTANGTNGGVLFEETAFDADGVSGGALVQVSATGITQIGQGVGAAQRVQGDGLSFLRTAGDVNFSTLNIFNNGGTGLEVQTKLDLPDTTFNLVVGAGGVNTTAGAALFLDPLTGNLTFGSITGSGSAAGGATSSGASGNGVGITVDGFIGTLTSGTTSITGLAAGQTGVNFTNNNAGTTVNLGVTTISSTANNVIGIDLQNTNGETISTGAGSSINLTGTGTVGVDLSAVGTNANFTFGDGTAPPSSTIVAATPIDFTGIGALGTYNFLDVDFTNVNLGVTFGQNGVHYFAQTAQGLGDGSSAANASNTTTADAVATANTTFIAVGGGNLDLNINGDGAFDLAANQDLATYATVGGTINVGLSGVPANILLNMTAGTVTDGNATGRTALTTSLLGHVVSVGENSQLTNVEINNSGVNAATGVIANSNIGSSVFTNVDISDTFFGLDLGGTTGSLTVDANSSITNINGITYREFNSTANVTFNGLINDANGNGVGIQIQNRTAGTTTFAGQVILNTGSDNGVELVNNTGATINFTGGLDIDTTDGIGFSATGGGTVSVSNAGAETINTAGTGQALVLDGVTIGAGGINFDSVTTAATTTGNAVDINDAAGGAITLTTVNLAGTAGTTGLDISGNARSSNVIIGGGTIASGVRISDDGSGTAQIDANISDNAGFAIQVANRDGAAGNVTINGTVTNSTGAVSLQSNTAGDVTFNGIVTGTGANNAGAIDIDNVTGGTNTFAALVDIDVTGNGTGVSIANTNAGGTFNFTGGLDINSVNGTGFEALSGTIGVSATAMSEQITTTNGQALNLNGVTSNITFDSVSSTNSAGAGIDINTVAGSFTVSGSTTVTNSTGHGIGLANNTGNVTFGITQIVDPTGSGIDINGAQGNVTVQGGFYTQSKPGLAVGFGVAIANQAVGSLISFTNFDITGTTADDAASDLFNIQNSAGTINVVGGIWQATNRNDIFDITGGTATVSIGATITQTGTSAANSNAVEIDDLTGGSITFTGAIAQNGTGSVVDANNNANATVSFQGLVSSSGVGGDTKIDLTNNNTSTFNFTGGLNIATTTGPGFVATGGGTINVSATAGVEQITTTNGQAVNLNGVTSNITFDSVSSTNSAGAGIDINTVTGSFEVSGITTVTDATGDGISLTGNAGTVTFGATNIDLGATVATAGVDIDGVNGQITFGATTITDVKTGQTGVDFTGADAPATFGVTAISGPVNSAGTGIDLSSTLNNRAITFATGSSITFTGTGASIGVQLASGDTNATSANANFTFGDGSGVDANGTNSTISVGASGFTVDTIGLNAANGTYNFQDVAFVGNADLLSAGTAIFVSQAGGALTAGTFGLSNAISTISVATAEAQADTNQTFTFVGNNIDFTAEGGDGFTLDDGQSVDGFANGNSVSSGSVVPVNVSGIAGGLLNVTANDTQITNSGGNTVFTIGGSSMVENVVIDGSAAASGDLFDISGAGTVTIQDTTIQNDTTGNVFDVLNQSGTVTIQNNTINVTSRLLEANGGTGDITVTRGTGTTFAAGTVRVRNKNGGGTVAFNGDLILNSGGIDALFVQANAGTTFNFNGALDIDTTNGIGVNLLSNNAATAINFLGGLDITTTNGLGFNATGGGTVSVANAGTEQITTTGTGGAINLNGVVVAAGGFNIDQVTTAVTSTVTGIEVNTTTGGAVNIASANLNGTGTGLLVSDANTTVNVVAGTINNGVRIVRGANPITIGADITKATGAALDIFRRNTNTVITINGNITSAATAVNVFQSGGADLTINGTVTGTGTDATGSIDLSENGGGSVIIFANQVTLNMTGAGAGVHQDIINGGADVRFTGGLDITTVDGTGLEILDGMLTIANAGTEQVVATGTGRAINLDSVNIAAGGVNFDQVTTSATTASAAVRIDDVTGGAITLTSVNLDGTAGTTGLDIGGSLRTANVVVSGGTIASGVGVSDSGTGTVQIDANISDNAGYAFQVANRGAGAGAITANGTVTNATGAVSLQSNSAGDVTFNGVITGTGANNAGAINIDNVTGGTVTFAALVDIDVTGNGTGVQIGNSNAGGTFNFNAGLDINSVNGVGFEALSGTVSVVNAGVEQVTTTGTAGAINIDALTVAAGGINFDSVTTAATATSDGIQINNAAGGAITFTTVSLAGTAGTAGLDISGNARTSNVLVSGGTINSGVSVANDGTGTVQIDANISDNAGHAFQVASRGAGAGDVTVNGTVTSATGAVSLQSNSAGDVTFNGIITGTGANNAGAIDIDNVTGGTATFAALVDIDVTGNGTGVSIGNTNAGGTFNFTGGVDVRSVNGTGFEALSGTVSVTNANVEEVITSGTAGAVNLDGITVGAGGIFFDHVGSAATATSDGAIINNTAGGSITFADVALNGIAGTTGLEISGNARTSNVVVSGGTINSGVSVADDGTGTVQIDANIADNAGYAFQVANRGAGAGNITVNGTVTNAFGAVSLQSNSAGDVTFNGIITGTGSNNAGAIDIDNVTGGTVTFAALVDIDVTGAGAGVDVINSVGGTFNFTGGLDINAQTGTGFNASFGGTVSVSATAGTEQITTTSGRIMTFSDTTVGAAGLNFDSITNTGANAFAVLEMTAATGGAINIGTASLVGSGVRFAGNHNSVTTFTDLDIALTAAGQTGINLSNAAINANLTANDFDVTSTTATSTTGVNIAATMGTGTVQLGNTNTNGGDTVTIGTAVNLLAVGVEINGSTNFNFILGDGDGAAGDLTASDIHATQAVNGVLSTNGTYNFRDIDFNASGVVNLSGGASFFVFDETGTAGAGTFADPGTAGQAEAASVDVLVAIDNVGVGGSTIDVSSIAQGAGNTLNLDDNQALIGLILGQSIDASTLGLGLSAGAPASFLLTGLGGSSVITGSGVASGILSTIATTGANNTVELAGTGTIQSIFIDNVGTGDGVNASYGAAETATIRSATITAAGGDAIDIVTTGGASTVNLEAATINGTLRLNGVAGGTLTANTVGAANTINAAAGAAVDINTVTTNLTFASITGNGGGATSEGIKFDNLGANSSFTVTGTTSLNNYTGRALRILNISQNDVSMSFGQTDINTTVGQVAASGQGVAIFTVSGTNFDFDMGALTVGNATDLSDRGLNVFSVNGAGADIDLASFTSTNVATAVFVNDFDSASSTVTIAGTTNITNAASDGVRIISSSADVTFAGNTTITNNVGSNGDGVDIGSGAGGNNSGTYSFAGLDVSVVGVGAFGLRATNSGTLNITGGTNNITSNNGTAVFINPTVVNAQFQSLTSSNSGGNGIDLTLASGSTFTVTGSTNVNSSNGNGVNIVGETGTQTVSLGALNINNNPVAAGGGLNVTNTTTGTLNVNSTSGTINSGNDTAIQILNNSTGTITLGVALTGVSVNGAATGINIDQLSSGTINGTLNTGLGGSIINTTSQAIVIDSTTGTLTIGQAVTSAAGRLADIQRVSAGGTVTLSGNLTGTGASSGIVIINNTGGTINLSGATNTVNTTATGFTGITLSANAGATVNFAGALDIDTTSGIGLNYNNGGTVTFTGALTIDTTTGAGLNVISTNAGSFTANNAGNTIATVSNEPINISAATVNATFATVSASALNGSKGIDINNHSGILTINGGTITNTGANDSIEITGGGATSVIAIATNVNSTNATSGNAVEVSSRTGGTVTLSGNFTDNNATGGRFFFLNNTGGATNITGNVTINTSTLSALTVTNNASHAVTFSGATTDIDATSGEALSISNGATINFNSTTSTTVSATSGTAIRATGGGVVTITSNAVAGQAQVTVGAAFMGVNFSGVGIGAGGVTLASVNATGSTIGMDFGNLTGPGAINIGTANLQNITTRGVNIFGTHTAAINITDLDISVTGGGAVAFDMDGATINANITVTDFDVTNTAAAGSTVGIDLAGTTGSGNIQLGDGNTNGGSTQNIGALANPFNTGVRFSATTSRTGTFTFGDGNGIAGDLTASNIHATTAVVTAASTGTFDFEDVDTSTSGFNSVGGPSIFVFDELTSTGAGTFADPGTAVEAEASSATVLVAVNDLTAGDNINLNTLGVSGGTLNLDSGQVLISLASGASYDVATLGISAAGLPAGLQFTGLTGGTTITATGGTISGTAPTITDSGASHLIELASSGNSGVGNSRLLSGGTTSSVIDLSNPSGTQTVFIDSNVLLNGRDSIEVTPDTNDATTINITGNTFTSPNTHAIEIATATGFAGLTTFTITGNTITDAGINQAIRIDLAPSSIVGTRMTGTIGTNTIGTALTANSGGAVGIEIEAEGAGTIDVDITNNVIREWGVGQNGLAILTRNSARVDATITNNTFDQTSGVGHNGSMLIDVSAVGADTSSICADIQGNNFITTSAPAFAHVLIADFGGNGNIRLPGYAGGATDAAAVTTFIQGNNTGSPTHTVVPGAVTFTGFGASCP